MVLVRVDTVGVLIPYLPGVSEERGHLFVHQGYESKETGGLYYDSTFSPSSLRGP